MIKNTADTIKFLARIGLQSIPYQFHRWGSDIPDGQFLMADYSPICENDPDDETNPCWFCVCATCRASFHLGEEETRGQDKVD